MVLPITNISLNDIHVEVGGSSGTTVSLNDTDVRGLNNPYSVYNEGTAGLGSSGTFITMGEFRDGYENVLSPTGTWVLAKLSLLSSSQYTFYVSDTDRDTESGLATANSGCKLKVKESSSHIEIWLDEQGDYQRARYPNGTIFDPGTSFYKIWSYAIPSNISGFSAKLNYTSTQQDGSENLDTSGVTLTSTAQSLSSDRFITFSTEVTADNGEGTEASEWSIDCTVTFERRGYSIPAAFRIWLAAEAESEEEEEEEGN